MLFAVVTNQRFISKIVSNSIYITVTETWNSIPVSDLEKLVESMPKLIKNAKKQMANKYSLLICKILKKNFVKISNNK